MQWKTLQAVGESIEPYSEGVTSLGSVKVTASTSVDAWKVDGFIQELGQTEWVHVASAGGEVPMALAGVLGIARSLADGAVSDVNYICRFALREIARSVETEDQEEASRPPPIVAPVLQPGF